MLIFCQYYSNNFNIKAFCYGSTLTWTTDFNTIFVYLLCPAYVFRIDEAHSPPDGDREQAKKSGRLFCASDKLENLVLRYRASEGTVMPSCLRVGGADQNVHKTKKSGSAEPLFNLIYFSLPLA